MRLTGDFIEDMEKIEEEYRGRACHYSIKFNYESKTQKDSIRNEKLAKKYFNSADRMKQVLKYIN